MALRLLLLLIVSTYVSADTTLQGVDLWLPKSYQTQFKQLVKAAKKAQSDKYCQQLLSGRLDESRSSEHYLYFHFRCRTEDRAMFSIQVEGPDMKLTNSYAVKQKELEAERQAELVRLQVEKEAELARLKMEKLEKLRQEQAKYWGVCRKALKKRLKYFEGVDILSEIPPKPVINDLAFTYLIDFDSLSPARKHLNFQASCVISGLEEFQLVVKPRKERID